MFAAKVLERPVVMAEIVKKAEALGIAPGEMQKAELIRAIQQAEGYTACFGKSDGKCRHIDCCFRPDCLQPERSDQSCISGYVLTYADKVPWSLVITKQWLEEGIMIIPSRLRSYISGTNTVHILYDQLDEVLPYEEHQGTIDGIGSFYAAKSISAGGRVHVQLRALHPTRLYLSASW